MGGGGGAMPAGDGFAGFGQAERVGAVAGAAGSSLGDDLRVEVGVEAEAEVVGVRCDEVVDGEPGLPTRVESGRKRRRFGGAPVMQEARFGPGLRGGIAWRQCYFFSSLSETLFMQ